MSAQNTNTMTAPMAQSVSDESILKISKEITVKFIEMGRITPATFNHDFKAIFTSIEETVRNNQK